MREPVVLSTCARQSYERAAIMRWLDEHPCRDPMTGITHDAPLVFTPNLRLKRAITRQKLFKGFSSRRRYRPSPHRKREDIVIDGRCIYPWEESSSDDGF